MCGKDPGLYELVLVAEDVSTSKNLYRSVSEDHKTILKEALKEKQIELSNHNVIVALGSTSCHGFSEQVISDVVENCHKIFSLEDVLKEQCHHLHDFSVHVLKYSEYVGNSSMPITTLKEWRPLR